MAEEKVTHEELISKVALLEYQLKQRDTQCKGMMDHINKLREALTEKSLDYLFKVVENSDKFPSDFVVTCTDNIVKMMTPVEEESKEE